MKLYKIAVALPLCLASMSVLAQCPTVSSKPAFPGAQGAGAIAKGGRCGEAIMVTNLDNGGTGSFRACVQATVPRTCIFRRGGTIQVTGGTIRPEGNLTIAGQSAPGGGIQIAGPGLGQHMVIQNGNHIIIRYIRFRKGFHQNCAGGPGNECGATLIYGVGAGQSIADHISVQWTQDESVGWASDGEDSTLSYSLASDPLGKGPTGKPGHPTGFVTQGNKPSVSAALTNIDMHHNLLMNSSHRNPLLRSKSVRVVSNLGYNKNLYFLHASGGVAVDVIGNSFKRGPLDGRKTDKEVEAGDNLQDGFDAPGVPSIYMLGNIGPNQSNASGNQLQMTCRITAGQENGTCGSPDTPIPANWRRSTPLPTQTHRIISEPVGNLEASILSHVGASRRLDCNGGWVPNRDTTDAARITQYKNNTGISVSPGTENTAGQGGFPTLAEGVPCVDSDLDGMPNEFENRLGLNNSNRADRNGDHDNDGYTNLEEYLDGVPESGGGGEPPPPPPVDITGTGAIIEAPGGRTAAGNVLVKGGPERRPFGRGIATQPPPPDGIITVGSRIIVDPDTGTTINVRDAPAGSILLGTQPTGAEGTVIDGPTVANGFDWVEVNFDTGVDGWVGVVGQIVETADAP